MSIKTLQAIVIAEVKSIRTIGGPDPSDPNHDEFLKNQAKFKAAKAHYNSIGRSFVLYVPTKTRINLITEPWSGLAAKLRKLKRR